MNEVIERAAPTEEDKERKLPFILEKLATQLGFGTDLQTIMGLEGILGRLREGEITAETAVDEARKKGIRTKAELDKLAAEGFTAMKQLAGPEGALAKAMDNLYRTISKQLHPAIVGLTDVMYKLIPWASKPVDPNPGNLTLVSKGSDHNLRQNAGRMHGPITKEEYEAQLEYQKAKEKEYKLTGGRGPLRG
jgi:hypothetical protein